MDREGWRAASPWSCKESDTTERLNWLADWLSYTGIAWWKPLLLFYSGKCVGYCTTRCFTYNLKKHWVRFCHSHLIDHRGKERLRLLPKIPHMTEIGFQSGIVWLKKSTEVIYELFDNCRYLFFFQITSGWSSQMFPMVFLSLSWIQTDLVLNFGINWEISFFFLKFLMQDGELSFYFFKFVLVGG